MRILLCHRHHRLSAFAHLVLPRFDIDTLIDCASLGDVMDALDEDAPSSMVILHAASGNDPFFAIIDMLRADERSRLVPVIVTMDRDDDAIRQRAIRAGADECVVLPASADEMIRAYRLHARTARADQGERRASVA